MLTVHQTLVHSDPVLGQRCIDWLCIVSTLSQFHAAGGWRSHLSLNIKLNWMIWDLVTRENVVYIHVLGGPKRHHMYHEETCMTTLSGPSSHYIVGTHLKAKIIYHWHIKINEIVFYYILLSHSKHAFLLFTGMQFHTSLQTVCNLVFKYMWF